MIEQPVPKGDLVGLAQVRQAVNVPVGVDESLSSPEDTLRIIQAGSADFYSLKTTKQGGLNRSKRIAALVEAAGGQIFVNSMIEMGVSVMSGLHFAASTVGLFEIGQALNSVRRLKDDILANPVQYESGYVITPQDRIGLGVELDPLKMSKYTIGEFWVKD
jgi:L-alanine-DL-glutamate epimerase-like enolase superfamily enzyme